MTGTHIAFDDREDLILLEERAAGVGWREIGAMLSRDKDTCRLRHALLMGAVRNKQGRPFGLVRSGKVINRIPLLGEAQQPVDDERHVARLCQLGGFRPLSIYAQRYGIMA